MRCDRLLSTLLLAAACPVVAADAQALDPIVVSGRGLQQAPAAAAYDSVLLPRKRLLESASGRLEDALRDVAGFQQFRRVNGTAANPTSQGATLRGIGGNASSRALVLLDGVPVADPFAGYIPWSALSADRLAFARVTRGGGIGAFGAGAVAGVIELESAGLDDLPLLDARGFYGSRESVELSAGVAPRIGEGFVAIAARGDRGDGYELVPTEQRGPVDVPARYSSWSTSVRAVVPVGPAQELQLRALVFDDKRLRGLEGTDNRSRGADASVRFVSRRRWGVDAIGYVQERDFASGFVAVNDDRTVATRTLDQYSVPATGAGGKLELRAPDVGGHRIRLGADVRQAEGETRERFRFMAGAPTRRRTAGGRTLTAGLFVEDDYAVGALTLTAGARVDHWRIADGELLERDLMTGAVTQQAIYPERSGWVPSFRGGGRYRITPALSLRAAGYSGFRQPTLNELYRPFRVGTDATAANAALENERLLGGEGGFDFRPLPGVRLAATGYYNRLGEAVANVTLAQGPGNFPQVGFVAPGGSFRQRLNVDAIHARGAEVNARLDAGELRFAASYAFTAARVEASGAAAALDGLRPAQTPLHQLSATFGWSPRTGADLALTVRHSAAQFEDDLNKRLLPAATTLDAYASVPVTRGLRLIARAENLTDELVVSGISASGIIDRASPRTLWIGISVLRGR